MKELIENNINDLYIEEFSIEKNIKLKSLIIMYLIMTRSDKHITELRNIIIDMLYKDNNFRINNEAYTDIIIKYVLSNGYDSKQIINNYIINGYYFHSTNGAFKETINNNGLIIKNKPWDLKEIDNIKKIFSKYGKTDIFGLYHGENNSPIFLSSNITSSSYYSISSPTWFLHFVSGGMNSENYDKEAYRNRDYDGCLNNILNTIKEYNLSEEESDIVINFFNKYYNILGIDTEPILLLIRRNTIDTKEYEITKNNNETDFKYIKRIINAYCSNNIMIQNNINKEDITIINYLKNKIKNNTK